VNDRDEAQLFEHDEGDDMGYHDESSYPFDDATLTGRVYNRVQDSIIVSCAEAKADLDAMMVLHSNATKSADQALRERIETERKEKELADKVAAYEAYGEDTFEDGEVIKFPKRFGTSDKTYVYAAIKANGKWYTTSTTFASYTWEGLVLWLLSGSRPTTIDEIIHLYEVEDITNVPVDGQDS
jgi:hypothetical protein